MSQTDISDINREDISAPAKQTYTKGPHPLGPRGTPEDIGDGSRGRHSNLAPTARHPMLWKPK